MQPRLMVSKNNHLNSSNSGYFGSLNVWQLSICCFFMILLAVLVGCDSDDDSDDDDAIELLSQSVVVDEYLMMVDKKEDRVMILDVSAKEERLASNLEIESIAPNPFWLEVREDSEEVLILSAGRRGVSQPTILSAVETDGKIREYEVGAAFDSIMQTEDGDYALLYFSEGSDELLFSLNEIAIVDLDEKDVEDAVTRQSIMTSSGLISQIVLSPTMEIGKQTRNIAVILDEDHAFLVDLVRPDRNHTKVTLNDGEDSEAAQPEQVVFNESRQEIYIRGANSQDIFALSLEPIDKDYTTSVSQIPLGALPSDMELYGEEEDSRLLVVSENSQEAHIIRIDPSQPRSSSGDSDEDEDEDEEEEPEQDLSSSQVVSIDLDYEADNVMLFDEIKDSEKDSAPLALLYQEGSRMVTLLDLDNAETFKEQNLDTIALKEPVLWIEQFERQGLAVVVHNSMNLDVIDMRSHSVRTIRIDNSFRNAIFNEDDSLLWFVSSDKHFISYVNIVTGETNHEAVLLEYPINQFVIVEKEDLVVAIHEGKVCEEEEDDEEDDDDEDDCDEEPLRISILDSEEPSRDSLVEFSGFPAQ